MEHNLNSAIGRSSNTPRRLSYSPCKSDDSFIIRSSIEFQHRKFTSPRVVRGCHALGKQLLRHHRNLTCLHGDHSTVIINKRKIAYNLLLDRYPQSGLAH